MMTDRKTISTTVFFLVIGVLSVGGQILVTFPKKSELFVKRVSNDSLSWLEFLPPYCHPVAPYSLAIILALATGLVFVVFRFGRLEHELNRREETSEPDTGAAEVSARVALVSITFLVLASLSLMFWAIVRTADRPREGEENLFAWLFLNTTGSAASPGVGWIWAGSIVCAALACLVIDLRSGQLPRLGGRWWEWILIPSLTLLAGAYYCHELTNWRYSVIGDEYAFLFHLQAIDRADLFPIFSESGVYGCHPELCSFYQLLFVKLLGETAFAWRFSSVFAAALSIPALYVFVRISLGVRPAIFAASLFAMSHYSYT